MNKLNRIITILLVCWGAIAVITTVMPLPNELQIFENLSNTQRWTALAIVLITIAKLKYPRQLSWDGIKNILHIGISWESRNWYFLGMIGSSNPTEIKITSLQFWGFNNSNRTLINARAFLVLRDGKRRPLRVTTSNGAMDNAASVDVEPRTKIYINDIIGEVSPNEFIETFAPIRFIFSWDQGSIERRYSEKAIKKVIRRFEKDCAPKPVRF